MKTKALEILRDIAPFNSLSNSILEDISANSEYISYTDEDYVFRAQEELNNVYIAIDGMAMAILTMSDGSESIIEFFKSGNIFGEAAAMASSIPPISVQAVQNLVCLAIARPKLTQLIHENPEFSEAMTKLLSERLIKIYRELHEEISHHKHGLESFSFRKKIGEFMTTPVMTCNSDTNITEIAMLFQEYKISSVVVTKKNENYPIGIVTESDLIKKVVAKNLDANKITAIEIMGHPLNIIGKNNYYYDALLKMVQNHIKHLPVVENDQLIGIITVKDLIKAQSLGTLSIVDSIEKQSSIDGLIKTGSEINKVLKALVNEQAPTQDIATIITEFNDRLTRKIITICEQEMIDEGRGKVPVDYCWLSLDYDGRKENIIEKKQRNALLYANVFDSRRHDIQDYFAILADKIVNSLELCGYDKCDDNINASNPDWRMSYDNWTASVNRWIGNKQLPSLIHAINLIDFRFIYGKKRIAEDLRYFILNTIRPATGFIESLTKLELSNPVKLDAENKLISSSTKEGYFDIKNDGFLHLVNCVRIFALRYGAEKVSTINRIKELTDLGHFSKYEARKYTDAFESFFNLYIKNNLHNLEDIKEPNHHISILLLSKDDQDLLIEALNIIEGLQNKIKKFLITSF